MSEQLTEHERKAFIKIFKAIDAVTKLVEKTAQGLPKESEMYKQLMNWKEKVTPND
jgi:translation initiation factor 2 alpha subunit (eIF-2alpha)